jgi:hypothetical protein
MDERIKNLWNEHRVQWDLMLAAAVRVQDAIRFDGSLAGFHADAVREFEEIHAKVNALRDEIKALMNS